MSLELLFQRRSIRSYQDRPVEDDKIKKLIEAGMAAPSARNIRPWHFVVIKDREILNKITDIHPYSSMLREAPMAIAVCGKHSEPYWVQDCSAAMQNILLAATAQGLGSVWLGIYPREDRTQEVKDLLDLPEEISPLGVTAIGYPNETKPQKEMYEEDKVTVIE
ncbi:nitroreductase family protein [Natranaerobius thermophilus]|uniref:Nitroreductase n=1 Tax=Natranaerobius thermophilus (strain ATCC BAA-1301 / DSM 18059 / JW/NM-WN-LF) TaxID=457570 RepID=B2A6N7_NATTJ|nr:nitroreductase family protein [Natranaerobius thermophilus]ACB84170.1 nitroreductase [Natranaerobius thermophilus JW/NM-WN-LF]